MKHCSALGICLLLLGFTAAGAAEGPIGTIKEVSGSAFIVSAGVREPAVLAGPIFQDDALETGVDSALGVTFVDSSRLSIGPDTVLTIDEYVFVPESADGAFLASLARGTLLYVSGLIAKLSPETVAVETPVSTIGIRGTKLMVELRWEAE